MSSNAQLLDLKYRHVGEFLAAYKAEAAKKMANDGGQLSVEDYVLYKHHEKLFVMDGNHRWDEKEKVRIEQEDEFYEKPCWHITVAQIFVGLTPKQAK